MPDELLKKLVDEYFASRPNLGISHAPLCIFFFACSGSGKSTIRRLIVEQFKATYVCNDEVRELLARHPEATAQGIGLKNIVAGTVEKIFAETPNKLVIFDCNIIQYYTHSDGYMNVARSKNRPIFIIGLETPEDELTRRVKERGVNVEPILHELPNQLRDYAKAAHDIKPNVMVVTTKIDSELSVIITQLRSVIA